MIVAATGLIGGLIFEGGSIKDIGQVTAAIIVLGGTIGAVMVNTPMAVLTRACRRLVTVFFHTAVAPGEIAEEIISYAAKARKNGIVSLEQDAAAIEDPFLRKALNLAVDGADLQELRNMMELEISVEENRVEAEAKVFESAGGYAPTIGIIGAVMGLIQVMKHLANIDEVGHGIAVAFVATVYGVAVSNLFFLPVANKIKARAHEETERRELILEGVVGIVEGLNPKLIRTKLETYSRYETEKPKAGPEGEIPKDRAA
jgi:chemotaxis protein MotA